MPTDNQSQSIYGTEDRCFCIAEIDTVQIFPFFITNKGQRFGTSSCYDRISHSEILKR